MKNILSVCVVLFNRWKATQECLQSIAKTVPPNWTIEWNVIDNGSSDETKKELQSFLKSLPGVVGFFRSLNEPVKQTQAVNMTMNPAIGEYMLRVDNDILFEKGWFEDCLNIINDPKFKNVGFVCPTHHLRQVNKNYSPNLIKGSNPNICLDMVSERDQNVPGNLFMKTSVAHDIGGFYTPYNLLHSDVHYCLIAKEMGYKWGYTWNTQAKHFGMDRKEDASYYQKSIHERRSEDQRYQRISRGDYKDIHPQEIEFFHNIQKMRKSSGRVFQEYNDLNVLIPSSGRRMELINMFLSVFLIPRFNGKIVTCGCDNLMPTGMVSDSNFVVSKISDEDQYIQDIVDICKKEKISYIFPVIDHDVKILSKYKTKILREGFAEVVSPDNENALKAFDKSKTSDLFKKLGFKHPETFVITTCQNFTGKFILKPRFGFSSKKIKILNLNDEEFRCPENMILQEYIAGDEFTTDIVSDRRNIPVSIVTRRRLSVRGGEVLNAKIENHIHFYHYFSEISKELRLFGPWNVQYKLDNEGNPVFIEINTRFGGGVPVSCRAGQNHALISLKVLERDFVGYHYRYLVEWGLTALRFDSALYDYIEELGDGRDESGEERLRG